jgi:hypothetical protein
MDEAYAAAGVPMPERGEEAPPALAALDERV